ncbi:transcriptional regulator [Ciceribacter lividus]|nr:transcriptional regulator [Ciceribacter lividus]
MLQRRLAFVIALFVLPALPAGAAMELLMFEQAGCIYCARWNEEVSPEYAKTSEGRLAPLRRLDLHGELPPELTIARSPAFTPTFVLVVDGVETGRIEGYPGEDFFWVLLDDLIGKAGGTVAK